MIYRTQDSANKRRFNYYLFNAGFCQQKNSIMISVMQDSAKIEYSIIIYVIQENSANK